MGLPKKEGASVKRSATIRLGWPGQPIWGRTKLQRELFCGQTRFHRTRGRRQATKDQRAPNGSGQDDEWQACADVVTVFDWILKLAGRGTR